MGPCITFQIKNLYYSAPEDPISHREKYLTRRFFRPRSRLYDCFALPESRGFISDKGIPILGHLRRVKRQVFARRHRLQLNVFWPRWELAVISGDAYLVGHKYSVPCFLQVRPKDRQASACDGEMDFYIG